VALIPIFCRRLLYGLPCFNPPFGIGGPHTADTVCGCAPCRQFQSPVRDRWPSYPRGQHQHPTRDAVSIPRSGSVALILAQRVAGWQIASVSIPRSGSVALIHEKKRRADSVFSVSIPRSGSVALILEASPHMVPSRMFQSPVRDRWPSYFKAGVRDLLKSLVSIPRSGSVALIQSGPSNPRPRCR